MESDFSCELCEKRYSSKCHLKEHYKKQHRKIPESFKILKEKKQEAKACPKCGLRFSNIQRHVKSCKEKGGAASAASAVGGDEAEKGKTL